MTRYARAVGSKAYNKRIPDQGTPWNKLKALQNETKPTKKILWKQNEPNFEHVQLEESVTCDKFSAKEKKSNIKEYKRRKPLTDIPSINKDGTEINIVRFEGFPIKKDDADRLKALKKKLLASKVSRDEIKKTMKLERRRAEKALAREKKKLCFHCRNSGHVLSECPELCNEDRGPESGICFKCGSTEHQHTQCKIRRDVYKHATCFICKQEGHISKQCPDNPRGLYPEGGSCRMCGDVTHLKKDCPKLMKKKKEEFDEITLNTLDSRDLDALDEDLSASVIRLLPAKKKKIIKM